MKRKAPFGIGIPTILTVLLVLCLTVFAALAAASARAEYALSQTGAQTVQDYYAADAKAQVLYAQFMSSGQVELDTTLAVNENQALHLHLRRAADGTVETLAWETIPAGTAATNTPDTTLPVWTGE